MNKAQLETLAILIRNERSKNGESPDYCRGIETIAKEIAYLLQLNPRLSPTKATQKADKFLTMCRML